MLAISQLEIEQVDSLRQKLKTKDIPKKIILKEIKVLFNLSSTKFPVVVNQAAVLNGL